MAVVKHRVNLNATSFPFLARNMAQTVIIRGQDTNYVPPVYPSADQDRDVGIPIVYWVENALPTAQGYNSVSYDQTVAAVAATFSYQLPLRDVSDTRARVGVDTAAGEIWVVDNATSGWVKKLSSPTFVNKLVTTAFVAGDTYLYIQSVGCYKYDFDLAAFSPIELLGVESSQTIGVVEANGYLIVWSKDAVAWSSTVDVTDFVPSLTTGAGGGTPEGIKGAITVLVPSIAGFVAYSTVNAVACAYSGNARYPYNFREIAGCGGVNSAELVAVDGNNGVQFAYTRHGVQSVSFQLAQNVQPELTDFLAGNVMETYNSATNVFSYQTVTTLKKKLTVVSNRYMIASYGVDELTHALVYDLALKRWGRLKVTHVDCFEYDLPAASSYETAKRSVAFLQADGTILTLNPSVVSGGDASLILGKYQISRSRLTGTTEFILENIEAGADFRARVDVSLTGKNGQLYPATLLESDETFRRYGVDAPCGKNVSYVFDGSFSITFGELTLIQSGRI